MLLLLILIGVPGILTQLPVRFADNCTGPGFPDCRGEVLDPKVCVKTSLRLCFRAADEMCCEVLNNNNNIITDAANHSGFKRIISRVHPGFMKKKFTGTGQCQPPSYSPCDPVTRNCVITGGAICTADRNGLCCIGGTVPSTKTPTTSTFTTAAPPSILLTTKIPIKDPVEPTPPDFVIPAEEASTFSSERPTPAFGTTRKTENAIDESGTEEVVTNTRQLLTTQATTRRTSCPRPLIHPCHPAIPICPNTQGFPCQTLNGFTCCQNIHNHPTPAPDNTRQAVTTRSIPILVTTSAPRRQFNLTTPVRDQKITGDEQFNPEPTPEEDELVSSTEEPSKIRIRLDEVTEGVESFTESRTESTTEAHLTREATTAHFRRKTPRIRSTRHPSQKKHPEHSGLFDDYSEEF